MADDVATIYGNIAADDVGGKLHQRVKLSVGADGAAVDASAAAPVPVREPALSATFGEDGITATTASTILVAARAGRRYIEIGNGGDSGIWVHFGSSAATVGEGAYLPAKSTGVWPYDGEVRVIVEQSGSSGPVGYVEW